MGADTLETSIQMAEMAIADGVTHVVGTPHAKFRSMFDPDLIRQRRDEPAGGRRRMPDSRDGLRFSFEFRKICRTSRRICVKNST